MKIRSATYVTSAPTLDVCPPPSLPEFAMIGRSNVGKSSLINLMTNKPGLAKVSGTPGKTRMINFFLINEKWLLVDLPGYGYAKTARGEAYDFNVAVGDYLEHRESLRQVFVLIDSRHAPQKIDLAFIEWLVGRGVNFSLIFTKTDKQSATRVKQRIAEFLEALQPLRAVPAREFTSTQQDPKCRLPILWWIGEMLATDP